MMRLLVTLMLLLASSAAGAAQITSWWTTDKDGGRVLAVIVEGEIRLDDDKVFARKVGDADVATIGLTSPGGNVVAALGIGRLIHKRRYRTLIPAEAQCASACALIWIAGQPRSIQVGGQVGFHAVSVGDDSHVTSAGNAMVGSYLGLLGLSDDAIVTLTDASPRGMYWLSREDADRLGIDVLTLDAPAKQAPPREARSVAAPPPSLTAADDELAARLSRAFNKRYTQTGMAGVNQSIAACYNVVLANRNTESAKYCAGLDILAFLMVRAVPSGPRVPVDSPNSAVEITRNLAMISQPLGLNTTLLRERASRIALAAKSMIEHADEAMAEGRVGTDLAGRRSSGSAATFHVPE